MKVQNKVIAVTGAGSGIGKALTMALLEKGAKVAAVDLNEEALKKLQDEANAGDNLSTQVLNTTDKKAVEKLPADVIAKHGAIDGVINNAGVIQPFVKVNDLDYKDIDKVINVNFYGTLYMTKSCLPELLKRPQAHIVNVSSMGGFLPVPGQSVYGASKAAVKLLSEGLYAELAETNVHVTVVFPGATQTNITKNSKVKSPKMAKADMEKQTAKALPAEAVAESIIKGIENDDFQVFTGKDSKSMNKLYRLSPKFATNFITKQMKSLLE